MSWRVIGASVEGSSHRQAGRGCDDAHGHRQAGELLLLAVADGAGSALLGGEGARIAVEAALGALHDSLVEVSLDWGEALDRALRTARAVLEAEAYYRGRPFREFATTLLLAACDGERLGAVQLGDGAVVARRGGCWERLTRPNEGEYANETVFLTVPEPERHASSFVGPCGDLEALVLLTDGLEGLALNLRAGQPHAPFFEALHRFAAREGETGALEAALREELASERIEARTDDDKTLLIARRVGEGA
ncbi:PP2C family serine/threonine-protein phosphatase [Calidithermus chliarophilus]|uniref:PP2C family serine/threonine-protein phosphatase n=1 Tax=Calidithermus chliarophilus TaxID=52023 RepID=UPI00146FA98C|nr:PP2C family serine/threonine-protein phosphatase [Calidithermus chliarophilus]